MWKCLICITLLFVTDVVVCKPDYLFKEDVNGWLKLHPVPATWLEAFLNCHYEGAVLASPINEQLATALRTIMRENQMDRPIFLGVTAFSRGDFMSIEGVPLADLSITWGTYANDKAPEKECLCLSPNEKTYICSCTSLYPYICYKRIDNTTVLNQCGTFDDNYHFYRATGSCYKYHKTPRSWSSAHKICAAEGGHLVILNDQREVDIVTDFLDKPTNPGNWGEAAHIGLRDWNGDQTWLTIHGEKIENVFHTWAVGQPNVAEGFLCSVIWTRGFLDDVRCTAKKRFVCEKDPNTSRFEDACAGEDCVATN